MEPRKVREAAVAEPDIDPDDIVMGDPNDWLTADASSAVPPEDDDAGDDDAPEEAHAAVVRINDPDLAGAQLTTARGGCEVTITGPDAGDVRRLRAAIERLETPWLTTDLDPLAHLLESGPAWAARAATVVPSLIPGVLTAGGLAVMGAEPKVGKTWLAMAVAVAVTTGAAFLGQYPVERSGNVLLVGTEGGHASTRARLSALAKGHGVKTEEVLNRMSVIWRRGVQLDDKAFMDSLCAIGDRYALVIIDVLRDAWGGEENSNTEQGRMLRQVQRLTETGPTVLLLHHMTKPQEGVSRRIGQRLRGSTALYGALDSGIYLEPLPEARRIKVTLEGRDELPAKPFTIALPTDHIDGAQRVTLDWKPLSDQPVDEGRERAIMTLVRLEPGITRNALVRRISGSKESTLSVIRELLLRDSVVEKPATMTRGDGRGLPVLGLYLAPDEPGSEPGRPGSEPGRPRSQGVEP